MTHSMTPQEHYAEAERLAREVDECSPDERDHVAAEKAQVHATLALAGFTRDGMNKSRGYGPL